MLYETLEELESQPLPEPTPSFPTVLIASPQGDSHLLSLITPEILLKHQGFPVIRLPQVAPDVLLSHTTTHNPILILTCLLDSCVPAIQHLLYELEKKAVTIPVYIGGIGLKRHNQQELQYYYSGPLFYCKNAVDCAKCISQEYVPA